MGPSDLFVVPPLRRGTRAFAYALVVVAALGAGAGGCAGAAADPRRAPVGSREPGVETCRADMAALPAGSFALGDAGVQVEVAGYCLDRTEVTVAAYATCVEAKACLEVGCHRQSDGVIACLEPEDARRCNSGMKGRADHPVNCVDWSQAAAYCAWAGKRLPSEAEWEWAARGGNRAWTHPWGREPPGARACWDGPGSDLGAGKRSSTCAVGSHPTSNDPWGVADLAGNVDEWTDGVDAKNPSRRIFRGGDWASAAPSEVSASIRYSFAPSTQAVAVGFRCAAPAR